MLRKILKKKIKEISSVNSFADANNIRRASLHDYLNGKKDLTTKVLFRVLKPLKMDISRQNPEKMEKVDEINLEDKFYSKGSKFKRKEIESCWKDDKTNIKAMVLKNKNSELELHFFE